MQITEGQLKKYIKIQKKIRGVTLSRETALKEASALLLFIGTSAKNLNKKNIKKPLKNK